MRPGAVLTICCAALVSPLCAQESRPATKPAPTQLKFAWPQNADVRVTCENTRGERSFTLSYVVRVRPGDQPGSLSVGRRNVRVTAWNGRKVPAKARAQLAPLEVQLELLPDVVIDARGVCVALESTESWLARCRESLDARVRAGEMPEPAARSSLQQLDDADYRAALQVQAKRPWDDWVGRWLESDFSPNAEPFRGEIEIASGDIVDGTFTTSRLGVTEAQQLRLRVQFEATGARLDAAAIKWRERLFGRRDEAFERVTLAVREQAEITVDPRTMRPAMVETERRTIVTVSDEARTFLEKRKWTFEW